MGTVLQLHLSMDIEFSIPQRQSGLAGPRWCRKDGFKQAVWLGYHGELSADTLFIDGTKIESFANKYKFVWKKAVTRRLGKMMEEIPAFFLETETSFGICIRHGNELHKRHLKKLYRKLMKLKKSQTQLTVISVPMENR